MATRRPRPSHRSPVDEAVASFYRAGGAFVAVGVTAIVLAVGVLVPTSGSLDAAVVAGWAAVGTHPSTVQGVSLLVALATLLVVAGCWLLGVALLADGYLEP